MSVYKSDFGEDNYNNNNINLNLGAAGIKDDLPKASNLGFVNLRQQAIPYVICATTMEKWARGELYVDYVTELKKKG